MCYLSLFCSLAPNIERRGQRRRFVGRVNSSTSGDERNVSILTLIHSSRALVGGNTAFAPQLYF
jgi:hypothetical protein